MEMYLCWRLPQLGSGMLRHPYAQASPGRSCVKNYFGHSKRALILRVETKTLCLLGNSGPFGFWSCWLFSVRRSHPHYCGFHICEFTYLPRFICNSEISLCGAFVDFCSHTQSGKKIQVVHCTVFQLRLSKATLPSFKLS